MRILQANLNRSPQATETLLELGIREKADVLLVQEPWILYKEDEGYTRTISHPAYLSVLPPVDSSVRPRTAIFLKRDLAIQANPLAIRDPDVQVIELQDRRRNRVDLVNIYNERDSAGAWTTERCLTGLALPRATLLAGDFNTKHPRWDPRGQDNSRRAQDFIDWLDNNTFTLQNHIGVGTFYRPHLTHESVLDLTFTKGSISRQDINWRTLETGSDHQAISIDLIGSQQGNLEVPRGRIAYNTKRANWEMFERELQSLSLGIAEIQDPDALGQALSTVISTATERTIPRSNANPRSKGWWTPQLHNMRKETNRMLRQLRSNAQSEERKEQYHQARNCYFRAIKNAKSQHWNAFLEKTDAKSIFKAMAYTKQTTRGLIPAVEGATDFTEKCMTFRRALFPAPPKGDPLGRRWNSYPIGDWKWEPLSKDELQQACSSSKVEGKTPGPDGITQEIISHAYAAIPETFHLVYSRLLTQGHHPICWRQAIGVILPKPNKPDYSVPKAYRIISLLNCLGKVLERILAQRLGEMAETGPLLHNSQMGGQKKKSAVDAALLLKDFVEKAKAKKHKASVVFLDVKGAFDHVSKDRLLKIMIQLRLPYSVIAWTRSFLEGRQLRLNFDGQMEETQPIETGVPQGSPISPILFLIYIRDLFPKLEGVVALSYIDDIALATESTSLRKNARVLQKEVKRITALGDKQAIQFDLAKTELLHFSTAKGHQDYGITTPAGELVKPSSTAVRWLGIWFDNHLTFTHHIKTRAAQALSSFHRMERLANLNSGLTARSLRQIYKACVTTVADYGSPIWFQTGRSIQPFEAIQNKAARKILGVFKTAPTAPTGLEAGLLPPSMRLKRQAILYSLRTKELQGDHPISKATRDLPELPPSRAKQCTTLQALEHNSRAYIGDKKQRLQQLHADVLKDWESYFLKEKGKKTPHTAGSYFNRFSWTTNHELLMCERPISSAYYSLRLGHGYFRSYLARLGKVPDDRCRCGTRESPEHLLLSCRLYSQHRTMALTSARSLQDLLLSKQGIKETLAFIRQTKIATRSWYLERARELEEEEV